MNWTKQKQQVADAEEVLREAMLSSDVTTLSELLSDDLIFINHLGQVFKKEDDLSAHRAGIVKIESIEILDRQFIERENSVVVSVKTLISGTFGGTYSKDSFIFLRVWQLEANEQWNIIAAQSTLLPIVE